MYSHDAASISCIDRIARHHTSTETSSNTPVKNVVANASQVKHGVHRSESVSEDMFHVVRHDLFTRRHKPHIGEIDPKGHAAAIRWRRYKRKYRGQAFIHRNFLGTTRQSDASATDACGSSFFDASPTMVPHYAVLSPKVL